MPLTQSGNGYVCQVVQTCSSRSPTANSGIVYKVNLQSSIIFRCFFVSDLEQFAFLIVRHHGNVFFSFMCSGRITCMVGGSKLLAVVTLLTLLVPLLFLSLLAQSLFAVLSSSG